jgi:hypothetical protein
MSVELGEACEEVPSNNPNRVAWFACETPPTADDVRGVLEVLRGLKRRRVFFWIGPAAWDTSLHGALLREGALPWPFVTYPVLVREVAPCPDERPTEFETRVVGRDEAETVLRAAAPWYSKKGIDTALKLVLSGDAELHGAFDGSAVAALGALFMDGHWGYLGWAGTDPAKRRRGGQSALIRSRMRSAAERGARWFVSETATAEMTSTNNLKRAGFQEAFCWHVYRWDDSSPA